jgi:beta-glucosidase
VQEELLAAVAATGRPFVVVLLNGRPLTISPWHETAPAILEAWHPGIEGGNAIADVLFGAVNPGGKLPVSFPRTVGQIPIYYNHENTGRPYDPDNKYTSKYLDLPPDPLYPFGFGLSYSTFSVSGVSLSSTSLPASAVRRGATVEVSARVTNTGSVAGDEVVQLYIRDLVASIVQPVRRLRGFSRVTLAPGASRTVRFRLGREDLGFWTNDYSGEYRLEPGQFELFVGTNSTAPSAGTFTLT